jgi:hypothetical protein
MNDACGTDSLAAPSASRPATRMQFGLGASLHHSITPSLRAAGFEDDDEDEDDYEAPTGRIGRRARLRPAGAVSFFAGDRALALDYKRLNKTARQIGASRIEHRHQILEAHLAQGSEVLFNRR